jgi:hypothetical protein
MGKTTSPKPDTGVTSPAVKIAIPRLPPRSTGRAVGGLRTGGREFWPQGQHHSRQYSYSTRSTGIPTIRRNWHHLGYERHREPPGGAANTRMGAPRSGLVTEHGEVPIDTPRDRDGSFSPKIVRKRQRRSKLSWLAWATMIFALW